MLEDTLVIWTTEFGRMPFTQGATGRDHNGGTFVTWLAGAGIQGGVSHGDSDEFGYQAVKDRTYCYDLHATILHLLGIDHERLDVPAQRHRSPADRRAWARDRKRSCLGSNQRLSAPTRAGTPLAMGSGISWERTWRAPLGAADPIHASHEDDAADHVAHGCQDQIVSVTAPGDRLAMRQQQAQQQAAHIGN